MSRVGLSVVSQAQWIPAPIGKTKHSALVLPALFFLAFVGWVLWSEHAFLFGPEMVPAADPGADDLFVPAAKNFRVLHAQYSRLGFYHLGPNFLIVQGLGERLLYDWFPLFTSYYAAQTFAISVTHGVALAFAVRLWFLVSARMTIAILCAVAVAFSIVYPVGGNPLTGLWQPNSFQAAATMMATGLVAVLIGRWSWLPLLTLGGCQLTHGHVTFAGIVPLLVCIAAVTSFAIAGRLPSWIDVRDTIADNRIAFAASAGIAIVFAMPIIVSNLLHWPGEIHKYLTYEFLKPATSLRSVPAYIWQFFPTAGVWIVGFALTQHKEDVRRMPGADQSCPSVFSATLFL